MKNSRKGWRTPAILSPSPDASIPPSRTRRGNDGAAAVTKFRVVHFFLSSLLLLVVRISAAEKYGSSSGQIGPVVVKHR